MNRNLLIATVVDQHVEELSLLWNIRRGLTTSGHVTLRHLSRFDHRIAAHQDGCLIAGDYAGAKLRSHLVDSTSSVYFAATVVALDLGDHANIQGCFAAGETVPESFDGIKSALGWISRTRLAGIGNDLLKSPSAFPCKLGIVALRLHGVDPRGSVLSERMRHSDPGVRSEAFRACAWLGHRDLVRILEGEIGDAQPDCRFWAAWSAVLLGNRSAALGSLIEMANTPGPQRARAFTLALQAMSVEAAHPVLKSLAGDHNALRWAIQGSGIVGDPTYVPWLIGHMSNDQTARLAGEAFTLITGTDLALLDLERKPPENFESGPNDNPDEPNVDMDPDDGLPWPDPGRIEEWWATNSVRFEPGKRYFMGAPVTREHCTDVLKNGYQRQRILAAHYLCLLEPGTPLFNTSAPAWRQQKLLAQMG